MSDYIKREDAITQIVHDCKFCKKYALDRDGVRCEYCTVGRIHQIIRDMPAADVVERKRKKGEWIEKPYVTMEGYVDGVIYHCSKCGKKATKYTLSKYCPNCGADMRGQDAEQLGHRNR